MIIYSDHLRHFFKIDYFVFRSINDATAIEHNFPKPWYDHYQTQNYGAVDPVLHPHSDVMFFWDQNSFGPLSEAQHQLMHDAKPYGINSGLTLTFKQSSQDIKCLTMISSDKLSSFKPRMQQQSQAVLAYALMVQKQLEVTQQSAVVLTSLKNYFEITKPERQIKQQQILQTLTRLNMIESKTMQLCLPASLKPFIQDNYHQLKTTLLKAANDLAVG